MKVNESKPSSNQIKVNQSKTSSNQRKVNQSRRSSNHMKVNQSKTRSNQMKVNQLSDWLIDWLGDRVIGWLTEWLINWFPMDFHQLVSVCTERADGRDISLCAASFSALSRVMKSTTRSIPPLLGRPLKLCFFDASEETQMAWIGSPSELWTWNHQESLPNRGPDPMDHLPALKIRFCVYIRSKITNDLLLDVWAILGQLQRLNALDLNIDTRIPQFQEFGSHLGDVDLQAKGLNVQNPTTLVNT